MSLDGTSHDAVAQHYSQESLLPAIEAALGQLGKTPDSVTVADLAPVGEFHIGGPAATAHLIKKLGFDPDTRVLDIGCGIGGTARALSETVAAVTGIDLTEAYVEAGAGINSWLGLQDNIELRVGNALDMPFDDRSFGGATMMHVGMNIEDKQALFAEAYRVLRPGARLGVYDIMRTSQEAFEFPVPWSSEPATSHVAAPEDYRRSLELAGFTVIEEENRQAFALEFFERLRSGGGPSPVGLQLLMGATAPAKLKNMVSAVTAGIVSPVELLASK